MRLPFRTLAVLAALLAIIPACAKKEEAKKRPPAPVVAAQATVKDVPLQLKVIGNVEASASVVVRPLIASYVSQVHFREGADVRKGQLLFTLDVRPAEAAVKKAEANLARNLVVARNAKADYERYERLVKDGIVTAEQAEGYRTKAESAEADAAAERANVENAKVQLAYSRIYAPIDGRTGNLAVDAGNAVKANETALVSINQLNPVNVVFSIPEKELARIKRRMASGRVPVTALPQGDGGVPEQGIVSFIDNTIDTATGTIRLKGSFANGQRRLWPGQYVDVVVTLDLRKDAVVIPSSAVQTGQMGQYVYVVKSDQTADLRQVTTGYSGEGVAVIEKGLAAGETVVTDGHMRLAPGAAVEIRKPEEKRPAAPASEGGKK